MKRVPFIFLLSIILIYIFSTLIIGISAENTVTGETITGEATDVNIAVSISVIGVPTLSIIKPKNETYLTTESILLDYSVMAAHTVWYNLDNLANITITSPLNFNTSQGSHILYLYANNSYGLTSKNVSFFVNTTRFIIIDDEYETVEDEWEDMGQMERNPKEGESTDFLNYSYEELQNLSNIIFHVRDSGKIRFNDAINVTNDENPTDNSLNLNDNTNISVNRIEINSTALPNFNKSATLYLYNLTFTNPRILKDGVVCAQPTCVEESYSVGTFTFNVTGFSVYSTEETPTGVTPSSAPSGGGGGSSSITKEFTLDKETIPISIRQGETEKAYFTIKNIGNSAMTFKIQNSKLEELIKIDGIEFNLGPGESKTIILDFIARAETIPTLYLGKLIIDGDGIEKEILVLIEVKSKGALFDVKVEILGRSLYVMPGGEVSANIKIFNLERGQSVDAFVEYFIIDENGTEIIYETETLFVETQTTFIKNFKIPEYVKLGKYVFYVKTTYDGKVASSTALFIIGEPDFTTREILAIIAVVFITILLIIILYKLREIKFRLPEEIKKTKGKSFFGLMPKKGKREADLKSYKRRIKQRIEKI
ncbi:MAG: hypothetical protein KKF68_02405 [Nanoarchaeota archaeon]|nr:hypothetical protein [Nanoarchaeota archaeon]